MTRQHFTSEPFEFSTGGVAVNLMVSVLRRATMMKAPIYNDSGGLLKNPLSTDSAGQVAFWIDPGDYDLLANGVRTPFSVIGDEPGGAGGGGRIAWTETNPKDLWTIPHALGSPPDVTIVRQDGVRVWAGVEYTGNDLVTISFGDPVAGTAYLRA